MPTNVDDLLQRLRPVLLTYTREVEAVTERLAQPDQQQLEHLRECQRQNDGLWRELRQAQAQARSLEQSVRVLSQALNRRRPSTALRAKIEELEHQHQQRKYQQQQQFERQRQQLQRRWDQRMEDLGTWAETKDRLLQLIYQQAYEIQRLRQAVVDIHGQEVEAWGEAWSLGAAEPPSVRSERYGYGVQTTDD